MPEARAWLEEQQHRFDERIARSRRGQNSWQTAGRLVPKEILLKEVNGVQPFLVRDVKRARAIGTPGD